MLGRDFFLLTLIPKTARFKEGIEDAIRFPTLDTSVVAHVLFYLYHNWIQTAKAKENDIIVLPPFQLMKQDVLILIDTGIYLDLPDLVEICCQIAAENYKG